MIIVIDYGSQYTQLIARRLRERKYYCEVHSWNSKRLEEILFSDAVRGFVLSGGPSSVYEEESPILPQAVISAFNERSLPILGICYGLQLIIHTFGGAVSAAEKREYGPAKLWVTENAKGEALLGSGQRRVWMSHGDRVDALPEGFTPIAQTADAPFAAVAHLNRPLFGLQFHPEVTHSERGGELLGTVINIRN